MIIAYMFAIAYGAWCAMDDLEDIGAGRRIRHGLQWMIRAGVVVALLIMWALSGLAPLLRIAVVGVAMAALFSTTFRISLNWLRGLDWRYVSTSNWYDRQWISLALRLRGNVITNGGLMATVVEAAVLVALTRLAASL